jgi:hypothetical protein
MAHAWRGRGARHCRKEGRGGRRQRANTRAVAAGMGMEAGAGMGAGARGAATRGRDKSTLRSDKKRVRDEGRERGLAKQGQKEGMG